MRTLIVIDMQNDFIDGSLGTAEAVAIVKNVRAKIDEYLSAGDRVIYTRDTHGAYYLSPPEGKKLPVEHCIKGGTGWQIADAVWVDGCTVIDKPSFGYMGWGELGLDAHGCIEIVGLCTDICVVSNALILKALLPEAQLSVDASCCAGVTPESHSAALTTMKMCQIDVTGE